jgi:flagellar biosynthesis regulator FlaF
MIANNPLDLSLPVYHKLLEEAREVAEKSRRRLEALGWQYPADIPAEVVEAVADPDYQLNGLSE